MSANRKPTCLVVDDEPTARKGLLEYIADCGLLGSAREAANAMEAAAALRAERADILFLDISMPGVSGLEFISLLPEKPLTIITTAHPHYAVQGYELSVFDYLLKPIAYEKFNQAVQRACAYLERGAGQDPDAFFFVRTDQQFEKVMIREIIAVEGMQNYVVIHSADKKRICYITLRQMEDHLAPYDFIKVHKSFLVAVSSIRKFSALEIEAGPLHIPVGKMYKDELTRRMEQYILRRNS